MLCVFLVLVLLLLLVHHLLHLQQQDESMETNPAAGYEVLGAGGLLL